MRDDQLIINEQIKDAVNAMLDRIRTEQKALITTNSTTDYSNGVMNCLNIIDKYKVESEVNGGW